MKNVFNSVLYLGETNKITWKFTYDTESGAWTLTPVEELGSYHGVCNDIFEAKEVARECAGNFISQHTVKLL